MAIRMFIGDQWRKVAVDQDDLDAGLAGKQDSGDYALKSDVPNITISSSNPSGGKDGDIWLKYKA